MPTDPRTFERRQQDDQTTALELVRELTAALQEGDWMDAERLADSVSHCVERAIYANQLNVMEGDMQRAMDEIARLHTLLNEPPASPDLATMAAEVATLRALLRRE